MERGAGDPLLFFLLEEVVMARQGKWKALWISIFLLGTCFFFPLTSQAEQEGQDPAGYTVESVIPQNQVDPEKTYYYLKVNPSEKQTIQVKVISTQKDPVTLDVAVHDAVSSSVGAINYSADNPKLDESLHDPITSMVKIKGGITEISVANFEEKIVEYEITPPAESFSGVKLGSLRFVKRAEESEGKQMGLVSEYARVVAIMLTEEDTVFNQGAELHLKKVRANLSDGRKVIAATIQNDQPKVLQKMDIKGEVRLKGEKKLIDTHEMTDFSVAPNSNFDFEIPLGLDRLMAGTYIFKGEATGDGRTWKWEKEFIVGEKLADKLNDKTVYKVVVPKWVPWVAILLLVCEGSATIYLIHRKRHWKERK